jgi:hypothetical protein
MLKFNPSIIKLFNKILMHPSYASEEDEKRAVKNCLDFMWLHPHQRRTERQKHRERHSPLYVDLLKRRMLLRLGLELEYTSNLTMINPLREYDLDE